MASSSSDMAPLLFALIGLVATGAMLLFPSDQSQNNRAEYGAQETKGVQKEQNSKKYLELKQDNILLGNKIDFGKLGLNPNIPTLIFAKASWCGHCVRATPKIQDIGNKFDVNIIELDETNPVSQKNLGVGAFPTFLKVDKNGNVSLLSKGFSASVEKDIQKFASRS